MGCFLKESLDSKFNQIWETFFSPLVSTPTIPSKFDKVDITLAVSLVWALKDDMEQKNVKVACKFISLLMSDYIPDEIMTTIDEEKNYTHAKLADLIEEVIEEPSTATDITFPSDVRASPQRGGVFHQSSPYLRSSYPPIPPISSHSPPPPHCSPFSLRLTYLNWKQLTIQSFSLVESMTSKYQLYRIKNLFMVEQLFAP